jgi:hypothetical protein
MSGSAERQDGRRAVEQRLAEIQEAIGIAATQQFPVREMSLDL